MATFKSGISTSGLASTPAPQASFQRRQSLGEYEIDVTLSKTGRLELITTPSAFYHFLNHMHEIQKYLDRDYDGWVEEWETLAEYTLDGIDLTDVAPTLHVIR